MKTINTKENSVFSSVLRKTLYPILSYVFVFFSIGDVFSQCGFNNQQENGVTITPTCNNQSTAVGSGAYQRFTITSGVVYEFNTCGATYNTQISGFNSSGTYVGLFNDDNGTGNNACGGGTASGLNWTATYSGELRVQMNTFNCVNWPGGGSATLNYRIAAPTTSTNGGNKSACVGVASGGLGGNSPAIGSGTWTADSPNVTFNNANSPNATATANVAGTYTLTWTINNGGCTSASSLTFTVSVPDASITSPASLCTGGSANLTFNFPSGVGPYDVVYSDGASNFTQNSISNGSVVPVTPTSTTTYSLISVTFTGSSCSTTSGFSGPSTTITVNQIDDASFSYASASFCSNDIPNPLPNITGLLGGTFSAAPSGLAINPTNGEVDVANSTTATPYVITYTTSGPCPNSADFAVVVNSAPSVSLSGLQASYCISETTLQPLTGSPAGGTFGGPGVTGSDFNPSLSAVGNNNVTYSYTDANNCTAVATVSVLTNGLPFVTVTGLSNGYCINDNTPVPLTGTPLGGTFAGTEVVGSDFIPSSASSGGLKTVSYSYTDPNGCSATGTTQTIIYSLPFVGLGGLDPAYCVNGSIAEISVFPPGGVLSGTGIVGTQFDPSLASVGGPYEIKYVYTDSNGCTDSITQNTSVINATPASISGISTSYCSSDAAVQVSVSPTGGILFGPGINNLTFNPAFAGTGTVTIKYDVNDSNGCSTIDSIVTTVNGAPVVDLGADQTICTGSSATLDAGSGFSSYLWNTGATTSSIQVTTQDIYTVSVTDQNGCVGEGGVSVVLAQLLTPLVQAQGANATCEGDTVTMCVTENFDSYFWNDGGSTTQCIQVANSGTYLVTVTDATGCTGTSQPTAVNLLPVPDLQIVSGSSTTFCVGGSVELTAFPDGLIQYQWSNNVVGQVNTVNQPGTYTVTGVASNGCSTTSLPVTVVVNFPPNPVIVANGPTNFCKGGEVVLTVQPAGQIYLWNSGSTTQSITVTESGSYSVIVLDGNGCISDEFALDPVVVTVNAPVPTYQISGNTFTVNNGPFVTYQWYQIPGGGQDTIAIAGATDAQYTATQSGIYYVVVVDDQGCSGESVIVEHTYSSGIGINSPELFTSFNIFPNPASNLLNLEFELIKNSKISISLVNALGQQIQSIGNIDVVGGELSNKTINVSELPKGLYSLVISTDGQTFRSGFVKN